MNFNADRHPAFRDQILDDSFQRLECASCQDASRYAPRLPSVDVANRLWIRALARDGQVRGPELEEEVHVLYFSTFGPTGSAAARELGQQMNTRRVFGWAALEEKPLCAQHGIDDASLERLKLGLLGSLGASTLGRGPRRPRWRGLLRRSQPRADGGRQRGLSRPATPPGGPRVDAPQGCSACSSSR